ncbi:MAG TPA: DUF1109 domain-containing protein [Terriglobales bacterium]|nr:DUF1109 domain-containing protein [Terriglobales bacterium]
MKTDQLIDMLSTNVEPVQQGRLRKTLVWALVVGGAAAFCLMLATVGLRTGVTDGFLPGYLTLKLLFTLSLMGVGAALLERLMRPGQDGRKLFAFVFLPFLIVICAGIASLIFGQPMAWGRMIFGMQWATCLLCIPLFAVVPFAALVWALRKGAPTNLRRAGAIAGLVAGALGATAYAFHCPDDSVPFIAIWYGTLVGLCGVIGAILAPRLLRW